MGKRLYNWIYVWILGIRGKSETIKRIALGKKKQNLESMKNGSESKGYYSVPWTSDSHNLSEL